MANSLFFTYKIVKVFFDILIICLNETENRFIFLSKNLRWIFVENTAMYCSNNNSLVGSLGNAYNLHIEILSKYEICAKSIINETNPEINNYNSSWIFYNSYSA